MISSLRNRENDEAGEQQELGSGDVPVADAQSSATAGGAARPEIAASLIQN